MLNYLDELLYLFVLNNEAFEELQSNQVNIKLNN